MIKLHDRVRYLKKSENTSNFNEVCKGGVVDLCFGRSTNPIFALVLIKEEDSFYTEWLPLSSCNAKLVKY